MSPALFVASLLLLPPSPPVPRHGAPRPFRVEIGCSRWSVEAGKLVTPNLDFLSDRVRVGGHGPRGALGAVGLVREF